MVLLAVAGNTFADEFRINDFSIAQGETKTISVDFNCTEKTYIAFEFYLRLPEGVSIALNNKNAYDAVLNEARSNQHLLTVDKMSDGSYHFICYSNEDQEFKGTEGEIISMSITADASLEVGELQGMIISQVLSEPNENRVEFEDFTFNITIAKGDGRIHFDETATSKPVYTAGEKGDITMARTINAGEWSTIVLPFNLTRANATKAFGADVQFATFSGFEVDYGDDEENVTPLAITLKFDSYTIPARGNLAGGIPVLIKTGKNISEIKLDGVTMVRTVTNVETTDDYYGFPGKFIGTFVKTTVPEDGLFLSGNKFWYSTGKTNIKAFRGWFELGAVLNKETDFGANLSFVIDGISTSVDGIPSYMTRKGEVYTVQGQYMGHDVDMKRLPSGIYIVDGKKMVVK